MYHFFVETLGFFVGIQCSILLLSAAYRWLDLSYDLKQHWSNAFLRSSFAIVFTLLCYLLGNHHFVNGLILGQLAMVVFHLGVFGFGKVILWRLDQNYLKQHQVNRSNDI